MSSPEYIKKLYVTQGQTLLVSGLFCASIILIMFLFERIHIMIMKLLFNQLFKSVKLM